MSSATMDRSSRTNMTNVSLQNTIAMVTDPNNPHENWTMIMRICDDVARNEKSAQTAITEIRQRLKRNPTVHGWRSIALTLTLLEALVNNSGKRFHGYIANMEFLKALKSVIASKQNPPKPIEEQVLSMIQDWARIFREDPDMELIQELYQDCKRQGYEFPPMSETHTIKTRLMTDATTARPTSLLPKTSQSTEKSSARPKTSSVSNAINQSKYSNVNLNKSGTSALVQHLSDEQICKLRSELDMVQINIDVLNQMLATLELGNEHPLDWQLLLDLYKTCKNMQARIVALLSLTAVEDIAVDLLRYNDQLNKLFNNYHDYMETREIWLQQTDSGFQSELKRDKSSFPSSEVRTSSLSPTVAPSAPFYFESDHDDDDQPKAPSKKDRPDSARYHRQSSADNVTVSSKTSFHSSEVTNYVPSEDNRGKQSLPSKLPPIRLTPLPNFETTTSTSQKKIRREKSAGISIKTINNDDEDTAKSLLNSDHDAESNEQKSTRQSTDRDNRKHRSSSALSSRIKRLTIGDEDPTDSPYKITSYRRIENN